MKSSRWVGVLLLALAACNTFEREEIAAHITATGVEMTMTIIGIKSDGSDTATVAADFRSLIETYQNLESDLAKSGGQLIDKSLTRRGDKLVAEYRLLAPFGSKCFNEYFWRHNGEVVMTGRDSISTNGTIIRTPKNVLVAWPDDAPSMTVAYEDTSALAKPNNLLGLFEEWRNHRLIIE